MKFTWKEKDFYIDGYLASQLDSLIYNIKDDWDFVILITGDRMVRIGKSVLALTICAYLAKGLALKKLNDDAYNEKNIFFDNKGLIQAAFKLPKYSILHYDEGREGLAASKALKQFQQDLIDFFTECGQLNHIFVIVAPDYFELKEDIAVGRSEALINVYRNSTINTIDLYNEGKKIPVTKFNRGYFTFFSRNTKAKLYDKFRTMRRKSYQVQTPDFRGRFIDQWPIDREVYLKMKKDSLSRFNARHKEEKISKDKVGAGEKLFAIFIEKLDKSVYQPIAEELGFSESYFRTLKNSINSRILRIENLRKIDKDTLCIAKADIDESLNLQKPLNNDKNNTV